MSRELKHLQGLACDGNRMNVQGGGMLLPEIKLRQPTDSTYGV